MRSLARSRRGPGELPGGCDIIRADVVIDNTDPDRPRVLGWLSWQMSSQQDLNCIAI